MNIYAVIVGAALIGFSIVSSIICYKIKKNGKIVKSIFREIEDDENAEGY